jgi:rubrerythrin
MTSPIASRRQFLVGAGGVAAAGLVLAACGDDDDDGDAATDTSDADPTTTTAGGGSAAGDLEIAGFAASLEVLAVNTYGAALDAATNGDLGEVPPAVANFVTTVREQHQAHLDAWNEVLTSAGEEEVTDPPSDLEGTVNDRFNAVTDVVGAAELALMLEDVAAATYLDVIPKLRGDDAVALAGSIQPIDMQHAAVLRFVLGQYPIPETFAQTERSAAPS